MARVVFLNERSLPVGNVGREEAISIINKFLDLMIALRKLMPRISLITGGPFLTAPVGDNYSIARWLNDTERDRRRLMLSLLHAAPFRMAQEFFGDRDPGVTIYKYDGAPFDGLQVEGIGLADMYGGFAASFAHDVRWRLQKVPVRVERLLDDNSQSFWRTVVRHGTSAPDVIFHQSWLLAVGRAGINNAAQLWNEQLDAFPHLRFLPRTEGDLLRLSTPAFLQVVDWLGRLNDAVAVWNPNAAPTPQYPPHTTNEGEKRKQLFWLLDGVTKRCFHMHGRYTPGSGRIHFWLSVPERKVVIGYVGPKVFSKL